MLKHLTPDVAVGAVPIQPIRKAHWESWLESQSEPLKRWVASTRFSAKAGTFCLVPGTDGALERVLVGLSKEENLWEWAALPGSLPEGTYTIEEELGQVEADRAALGWALGSYRFERYRKYEGTLATLIWPAGCRRDAVERAAEATFLVRDLTTTPASDMGPEQLAAAAGCLADDHGGTCRVLVAEELEGENYPAIYAVGKASARAPRLIDLRWGNETARKVTLAGKGVCFDSGGLDLKHAAGMKLMKKDMGGAAQVLGLGKMIMSARLPVRLRILIPAVENAVSGNALRPLDVVSTRKGLSVEIGNTDAEGRVVLADALTEASREKPELIVDCATLTGAARVALGTELPAVFTPDDALAESLLKHGEAESDLLWRLPLWKPYRKLIESKVADLANSATSSYGGAITGALFLSEFVGSIPWIHLDLMAWNTESKPGRPEGGEAMGMRALFALLAERFA